MSIEVTLIDGGELKMSVATPETLRSCRKRISVDMINKLPSFVPILEVR